MSSFPYNPIYFNQATNQSLDSSSYLENRQDQEEQNKRFLEEQRQFDLNLDEVQKQFGAYRTSDDRDFERQDLKKQLDYDLAMRQQIADPFMKPEAGNLYQNLNDPSFDELIPTVAITDKEGETINPRLYAEVKDINEITFRGRSIWGKAADRTAEGPQINELITRNAQALKFFALRIRGGSEGQLWKDADPRLKEMFKEDPKFKAYVDYWTGLSPYFYDVTSGFQFFGFNFNNTLAANPLEVLSDASAEGWNPKEAIELLPEKIKYTLFNKIGLTPERLLEEDISKNPQTFKFFIADAIDTYAYGRVVEEYKKQNGWLDETTWLTMWPLLRDSLNSNDTVGELALIGAGLTATLVGSFAGGAGAPVGLATAATGTAAAGLNKITSAIKLTQNANRLRKAIVTPVRVLKTKKYIGNGFRFLAPHNITEGLLQLGAKSSPRLKSLLYTDPEKIIKATATQLFTKQNFKNQLPVFGRYLLRSGLNGAGQGVIEDVVRQSWEIEAGFKEEIKFNKVLNNMIEEAVGEMFLGGLMNFTSSPLRSFNVKVDAVNAWSKKVKEGFTPVQQSIVANTWNKLSKKTQNKLNYMFNIGLGIDVNDPEKTIEQQVKMRQAQFEFLNQIGELEESSGISGLLEPGKSSNPLLNSLVSILHQSDSNFNSKPDDVGIQDAHLELLGYMRGAMLNWGSQGQKQINVSGQQLMDVALQVVLAKASMSGNINMRYKILEAVWKDHVVRNNPNVDPSTLNISNQTKDEETAIIKELEESQKRFLAAFALNTDPTDGGTVNADGVVEKIKQAIAPVTVDTISTIKEELTEEASETGQAVKTKVVGTELHVSPVIKTAQDIINTQETKVETAAKTGTEENPTITEKINWVSPSAKTTNGTTFYIGPSIKEKDFETYDDGNKIEETSLSAMIDVLKNLYTQGNNIENLVLVYYEVVPRHELDPIVNDKGNTITKVFHPRIQNRKRIIIKVVSTKESKVRNEENIIQEDDLLLGNVLEIKLFDLEDLKIFAETKYIPPEITKLTTKVTQNESTGKQLQTEHGALRLVSILQALTPEEEFLVDTFDVEKEQNTSFTQKEEQKRVLSKEEEEKLKNQIDTMVFTSVSKSSTLSTTPSENIEEQAKNLLDSVLKNACPIK